MWHREESREKRAEDPEGAGSSISDIPGFKSQKKTKERLSSLETKRVAGQWGEAATKHAQAPY
jgi:hypothetical protein